MREGGNIAIAGLGTVGGGVLAILAAHQEILAQRAGRPLRVVAVSARDRTKDRGADLSAIDWHDDPKTLADAPDIDIVVETIGGEDGPALDLVQAALAAGKSVVTANKALIARHGAVLAALAEENGAALRFEAAVAGGIPIIHALRESLAGNLVSRVYGILNGTCNYILTTMEKTGREFADVLAEAQDLGYAEADPGFDIDGTDSAHKLAILAALAFGRKTDIAGIHVEGIRDISQQELDYAAELGCRIKLLAVTRLTEHGIEERVHPAMVPKDSPIAGIDGVYNGIVVEGDFVGTSIYEGHGAGAGPTASSVVGDIIGVARGDRSPAFGIPASELTAMPTAPMHSHRGAYYLRMRVIDRPGVMAEIGAILRDHGISIESLLQHGHDPGEAVSVVLTTHETEERMMRDAVERLTESESVVAPPVLVRIEEFLNDGD